MRKIAVNVNVEGATLSNTIYCVNLLLVLWEINTQFVYYFYLHVTQQLRNSLII